RLARGALDHPPWRLEVHRARRDPELRDDRALDRSLDGEHPVRNQVSLVGDLGDDDDLLRPEIGVEETHGDRAAVVDGRMRTDDLLDVLRIDVLAGDDDEVLLAADHVELAGEQEPEIAGPVPAVAKRLFGE